MASWHGYFLIELAGAFEGAADDSLEFIREALLFALGGSEKDLIPGLITDSAKTRTDPSKIPHAGYSPDGLHIIMDGDWSLPPGKINVLDLWEKAILVRVAERAANTGEKEEDILAIIVPGAAGDTLRHVLDSAITITLLDGDRDASREKARAWIAAHSETWVKPKMPK